MVGVPAPAFNSALVCGRPERALTLLPGEHDRSNRPSCDQFLILV